MKGKKKKDNEGRERISFAYENTGTPRVGVKYLSENIIVQLNDKKLLPHEITISNIQGQQVYQGTIIWQENNVAIPITTWKSAVYLVAP